MRDRNPLYTFSQKKIRKFITQFGIEFDETIKELDGENAIVFKDESKPAIYVGDYFTESEVDVFFTKRIDPFKNIEHAFIDIDKRIYHINPKPQIENIIFNCIRHMVERLPNNNNSKWANKIDIYNIYEKSSLFQFILNNEMSCEFYKKFLKLPDEQQKTIKYHAYTKLFKNYEYRLMKFGDDYFNNWFDDTKEPINHYEKKVYIASLLCEKDTIIAIDTIFEYYVQLVIAYNTTTFIDD